MSGDFMVGHEGDLTGMAGMLARHGVMPELDAGALARYAVIWCRWIEAEAEVKRRGPVAKTEGGNIIQNPFLSVANRCLAQMAQIESEFGLTPSSRSRIHMAEPADRADPSAWSSSPAGGISTISPAGRRGLRWDAAAARHALDFFGRPSCSTRSQPMDGTGHPLARHGGVGAGRAAGGDRWAGREGGA